MIVNDAFAIMDSLTDGTDVRVYDAADNLVTIGVIVTAFKNGFRVANRRGYDQKEAETTFFYKNMPQIVKA